ncbi:unnamed protein product [Bursaphelenchus okinawaensis]|uniref:Fibronectin type-III domain-containing protein n=1 Tax=Bursaphelenchus okinawaensis TaxID=465554 RepID=A0A811KMB2_9BILA|nr:unnamed protein product [Bursaphelenchus okinawaensis]CAG9106297.1 unnamed protein product [Bursaphelenchus okinawaensis]
MLCYFSKEDAGNYTCQVESEYGYNSWSGYLQVEEHNNPSAVFERMPDRSQLPAAPSQPRVNVRRPNQIDIEWDPPSNHGASPVTHYTLQYWNPHPGAKTTWTTVNDRINGLKYRVVGVQPGQQYFFIVRANNALGMGEPSPMSQMALTYADQEPKESTTPETTVALQKPVRLTHAKTINSSTALLTWSNGEGLNNDGFYLTWRGPPLANGETIMNITEPKVSSILVNGLKPYSTYDFFLIPYKNQMNLSPSNSIELRTPEGIPDPPRNVFARMENLTSVLISFGPPSDIRGILKGFDIQFTDNSSDYVNTIRTRANARSVTLRNLTPNKSYQAHVATLNGEGRSEYVSTELFTMNEATLFKHHQQYGRHESTVSPWKVGAGAGFTALILVFFAMIAFCWCRYGGNKKRKNSLRHRPPSTDFIKINDGSVATGREDYWPESAMPFHIPPPPPPPNGLNHQCSGMTVHSHMNMSSPRSAHYFHHHPCCAPPMMNAYGTTVRPHYAGPYCAGSSTLGREEGQYHYAVLPPTSTLPHHATMVHYEDDPSPYASTTVTSNGYGPTLPSNPPPMFVPQQLQQKFMNPPNGSIRRTATQPAQSTQSQQCQQGRRTPRTNPHFFNDPPAPAPQQDNMELGRILAQVPPPPLQQGQTYDSVTEDFLAMPNYKEEGPPEEERNKDLPNRTTNSRSPPRNRNGTAESEERYLLN